MDDERGDPEHWRKRAEHILGRDHPVTIWHVQHAGHDVEVSGGGFNSVVATCRTCGVSISIG